MKGNDEITGLFRSRLADAEMTVRDGFWEELTGDLPAPKQKRAALTPRFYRMAAAASVVLVLGAASAAFWYFSPKEEIQEAFTKVATLTPEGSLNGDVVQEKFPSIHDANPTAQKPGHQHPAPSSPGMVLASNGEEDEEGTVSVTVSITITQRVYGNHQQGGNGMYGHVSAQGEGGYHATTDAPDTTSDATPDLQHSENMKSLSGSTPKVASLYKWALKAGVGTSLPKGDFGMPFTASLSAERSLSRNFSLEAGLQYNRLDGGQAIHTLAVPVKLNATLAQSPKMKLYATLGGAAEKCIAGAPDNGFGAEPVQLSVSAGLGVQYKLSNRIALFAEPTVSHHFDTDSQTRTLHTERATNLNLLCGVRMAY